MFRIILLIFMFSLQTIFAASSVNPSADASCPVKVASGDKAGVGQAVGKVIGAVIAVAQSSMGVSSVSRSSVTISGKVGGVTPTSAFMGRGNENSAVPSAPFGPTPVGVVTAAANAIISPTMSGFNMSMRIITLPNMGGKPFGTIDSSSRISQNGGPGTSPNPVNGGGGGGGGASCTGVLISTRTVNNGQLLPGLNPNTNQVCTNGSGGVSGC